MAKLEFDSLSGPTEVDDAEQALTGRARQAGRLVLGCVPLLVVAGIVEGFFSPALIPAGVKFTMAAVLFALLTAYLLLRPRKSPQG